MKKLVLIALTLVVGIATNPLYAQKKGNEVVCYKSNMDCADCETKIVEYLKFEKGVKDLKVDYVSNTILVEYKSGKNDSEGFARAIKKKGYKAEKISLEDYKKITGTDEHGHKHDHKHEEHKEK
jgi:cation transport ATPase